MKPWSLQVFLGYQPRVSKWYRILLTEKKMPISIDIWNEYERNVFNVKDRKQIMEFDVCRPSLLAVDTEKFQIIIKDKWVWLMIASMSRPMRRNDDESLKVCKPSTLSSSDWHGKSRPRLPAAEAGPVHTILHFTLHSNQLPTLNYIQKHCIAFHCPRCQQQKQALHTALLNYIEWHFIALQSTTLQGTILHFTQLHCTLHLTTL